MSDTNSDAVGPWRALLRAYAAVINRLEHELASEVGLPLGWYGVLLHLSESPDGRLRMHELADSLLLSRSALTRFVDRMENAGLVRRVACPVDGRGLEVVMTEAGRALFQKAGRVHLRGIKQHFSAHLEKGEAAVIERAMSRVLAAMESDRDGDAAA